jgi:hypothetical protein
MKYEWKIHRAQNTLIEWNKFLPVPDHIKATFYTLSQKAEPKDEHPDGEEYSGKLTENAIG